MKRILALRYFAQFISNKPLLTIRLNLRDDTSIDWHHPEYIKLLKNNSLRYAALLTPPPVQRQQVRDQCARVTVLHSPQRLGNTELIQAL